MIPHPNQKSDIEVVMLKNYSIFKSIIDNQNFFCKYEFDFILKTFQYSFFLQR